MSTQVQVASDKSITEIFEKQKFYLPVLKRRSARERVRRLKGLAEIIREYQGRIEEAGYKDFYKPAIEVRAMEVYPVLNELSYITKYLKHWMKPRAVPGGLKLFGTSSEIVNEPVGNVLVISPWNYPFHLTMIPVINAIAAGNSVIIKPSEMSPYTSEVIQELIDAVFDRREVSVIQGDHTTAEALLEQPFNHIVFTGSQNIGRVVMEKASSHLAGVTLELGGKTPALIDTEADLKKAVPAIAWGKMANAGQTCIAPDYVLVPQTMKQEVLDQLAAQLHKAYGDTKKVLNGKDFARIVNSRHFRRLQHLLDDAIEKGAEIVYGGDYVESDNFIEPTMITDIPQEAAIMEEEIFGPILPVVTYTSLDQALNFINRNKRPLGIYAFTKNKDKANDIIARTTSGNVVINDVFANYINPALPFGGINDSGMGRLHGEHGFRQLSNEKSVVRRSRGWTLAELMMPPYKNGAQKLARLLMKYF